jgi:hypothetical protein
MTQHKRLWFFVLFGLCIALAIGAVAYAGQRQVPTDSGAQISNWSAPVYTDCKSDCNAELKRATKECDTLYPPDSRSRDHTDCLNRARNKYDACMAICKG